MAARRPRTAPEHESDDDSYEVLDLTEYARRHHWWNRLFGRNSGPIVEKYSVATQIVMGGVTGCQQNLSNRTSWSPVDLLEAFCWALRRKDLNHLFVMAFASKNSCGDTLSESSVDHWALQSKMRGLGRQLGSFYILGFCLLKLGKTRIC
uniref:FUN14 domain containing 1 n=1 Tax=Gallus gallus TaxID=9031 RepID=A0A8V0YB05_CHICK